MRRKILFRGKRVDNGEWVFGSYFKDCDDSLFIIPSGMGIFAGQKVKPETVGQFTGLHDKNGMDIYEGDNFKDERAHGDYSDDINEIMFKYGKFGFPNYGIFDTDIDSDYIEVIGNIHDNTDILK